MKTMTVSSFVCKTLFSVIKNKEIILLPKVQTEDFGKIFEMGICLTYQTPFVGNYKYSMEDAHKIKDRIQMLPQVFPHSFIHTAKNGNKYDFMSVDKSTYLSAKTTKKNGKVCPQVIGQPSKKKFCEFFQIQLNELEEFKQYIEQNIYSLLTVYSCNTFDCPIIYYNKHTDRLLFIRLIETIDWSKYVLQFGHILKNKKWNESTGIYIDKINIGEFQVHTHRDCIKFRWSFEKLLVLFKDNFEITIL